MAWWEGGGKRFGGAKCHAVSSRRPEPHLATKLLACMSPLARNWLAGVHVVANDHHDHHDARQLPATRRGPGSPSNQAATVSSPAVSARSYAGRHMASMGPGLPLGYATVGTSLGLVISLCWAPLAGKWLPVSHHCSQYSLLPREVQVTPMQPMQCD